MGFQFGFKSVGHVKKAGNPHKQSKEFCFKQGYFETVDFFEISEFKLI